MARSTADARGLIDEIEQPFITPPSNAGEKVMSLRDRMARFDEYVFSRYDYAADLSPLLTQKISVGALTLRFFVQEANAALADDLKLHLEPVGGLKRDESAADRMELCEAHDLLMLDPHGFIAEELHDMQVRGFFFAAWMNMEDFTVPTQARGESDGDYADRLKRARAAFYPFSLEPKPPNTVAFTEDNNRKLTMAVVRYKLPVIELLERFGKSYNVDRADLDHAAKVFNAHFGGLRGGTAQSDSYARDFWQRELEVCALDDGITISHYVDFDNESGRARGSSRYELPGDAEFPNPFGAVSLLIAEGVYNAHQPVAYRREPLLTSNILVEDQRALQMSLWASRIASPPHPYEHKVPAEVMIWMGANPDNPITQPMSSALILDRNGRPLIQRAAGEMMTLEAQLDPIADRFFSELSAMSQIVAPGGLLMESDASNRLSRTPATTVLAGRDERKRMLARAQHSETSLWSTALDMIKHARKGLSVGRETGSPPSDNDWPWAFTTSGNEKVLGKSVDRGTVVNITPQDLDGEYTRTIEVVDSRASTRMADMDIGDRRKANGSILDDEYLESQGVENLSQFRQRKTEEQLYQMHAPALAQATLLRVAQFREALDGTPVAETMASAPTGIADAVAGTSAPQGTMQMSSPRQEGPGAATASVTPG